MKTKNSFKVLITYCVLILSCLLVVSSLAGFFLTDKTAKAESLKPQVAVKTTEGQTITNTYELYYSTVRDQNFRFSILIQNYNFLGNETIRYMVKKPNSVKYQALFVGSNAPTISGYSSGLVELNPYEQLRNIGEYYIIAQIVSGSEAILVNGISINIVPSVEEQYQLEIRADEIKGEQNELSTYYLSAKILLNGEQVNPDNLLISWYYEGATEPFRRMNSDFYWTPEEPGIYTIFARIEGIENVIIQSKTPITIAVAYNNTNVVLIGIAVAVAVAFLGVVLVTVVKVKREKVW